MVETRGKTMSVRTMTMKRMQPTGNGEELVSKPRNVTALAVKRKVRMRLQGENEEGRPTK